MPAPPQPAERPVRGKDANLLLLERLVARPGLTFSRSRAPVQGAIFAAAGWVLIGLCLCAYLFLSFAARIQDGSSSSSPGLLPHLLLMAGGAAGAWCLRRGRQLNAVSPHELLRHDSRPPVIYLRSFLDDGKYGSGNSVGSHIGLYLDTPREEEDLAAVMAKSGPFLAIGNPKEPLPELGAARIYVPDAHWQEVVKDLVADAQLVILRAGETPGLMWEVQQLAARVPPGKVVFYVPDASQYPAFRENANAYLPRPLPESLGGGRFLVFGPDWTPRVLARKVTVWNQQITGGQALAMQEELRELLQAREPPRTGVSLLRQRVLRGLWLVFLGVLICIVLIFGGTVLLMALRPS